MEELHATCERIRIQRQKKTLVARSSFGQLLQSIDSLTDETLENEEKLLKIEEYCKRLEGDLGEHLVVKTCKDAKYTAIAESLSSTIARTEQLKQIIHEQTARRNEHAEKTSHQSCALKTLEEKSNQYVVERENIEVMIQWYNNILGFRTESGEGVKFIFNKIDLKQPDEEYSFTIRLNGDIYTLLHCDPHLEDITELVKDLNETNGLFKFVRIMREKFQAAALNGVLRATTSIYPLSSSVFLSSPPSASVGSSDEQLVMQNESNDSHLQYKLGHNFTQKSISSEVLSPSQQSMSALRRSPRLMAKFAK